LQGIKERFPKALKLQSIPEDENLWKLENYERYLEARRELMATQLNAYLEGITGTEEAGEAVSIEDLIKEGESDELEFKSTLRWDLQQGIVNRKLEDVIVKIVAAFGNSQGGTLIIGVDDDGNIIGLEHDYLTLDSGNRDKFELHCRNLLGQHFDISMITNRIHITFHEVDSKDVCQIDVEPATRPIVLKIKDKNGQQLEKFYIRSGNASQEVALSEMSDYLRERFR
jgi:predicted HTH transcriptional regulator